MALVSRDPFAREELHSAKADTSIKKTCDWCGSSKNLKVYRIETDGGRKLPIGGYFCSNSCRKSYHGGK